MRLRLLLLGLLSAAPVLANPTVELTDLCKPEQTVCVNWFYRRGFDADVFGKDPGELASSKDWKKIEAFPLWVGKLDPENASASFATYTFVSYFQTPPDLLEGSKQPGIALREIGEAFEVYINGTLVAKEGTVANERITFHRTVRDVAYEIDHSQLHAGTNQIVFKIHGDPRYDHTGFYASRGYRIGQFQDLVFANQDRIGIVLICLYLFVGLYHLLLYFKRKQDAYNLYYALFAILLFVYLMTRQGAVFELPIDTRLIQRVELMVLYLLGPLMIFFFDTLFRQKITKLSKVFGIYGLLLTIITAFLPMHLAELLLRVWQVSILLHIPYGLYQMINARIAQNRDAGRLLAGFSVFLVCAVFDILDSAVFNYGITLTKYGFSVFIIGIALILANRFMRVHNAVEELNESLERKVEDRTRELKASLDTVHTLKVQQDGDYFLTSLLIAPLNGSTVHSKHFSVETLISQKKKFRFKKWDAEIGGDIVTAHNIELSGRSYIAFLNGDAMGKSMQGASGALVLGTVFKAVVTRTQNATGARNRFPERWLKECFLELQNVFVSFDGTMLISAVLGLADEQTGLIYYINAEHPWIALYRNGKAEFAEKELLLRKIGIYGLEGNLSVKTFQLQAGDVLFLGSDGRDDLALSVDAQGHRLINEDENLFLRQIEQAQGDIKQTYDCIQHSGEIIDDLTLMRIGYREDEPLLHDGENPELLASLRTARDEVTAGRLQEAIAHYASVLSFDPNHAEALREISHAHARLKNFTQAANFADSYGWTNPADTDGLYFASYFHKMAGDYKRAADFGEAVRLREPALVKNLVNLADSYRMLGEPARAEKLVQESLALDPQNESAKRLREILERKAAG
ncbi:MAG: SpoIIE family protein phosphatase [Spirochaetia bacterium]|nr:SpoIIE family protein phosphatase [Spirochaetia bacterium]